MQNRKIINQEWLWFYQSIAKPDTSNQDDYPQILEGIRAKGRYINITTRLDEVFPRYNANCYIPEKNKLHLVLEGPAQDDLDHCKRFMACLLHPKVVVTDIIAAGDPKDGRIQSRGFLDYFNEVDGCDQLDVKMREQLASDYKITTQLIHHHERINQYQLVLTPKDDNPDKSRVINVHQLASFVDFGTEVFSVENIEQLVGIYQSAQTLAIHCSAGMGRSGVVALAFMLFAKYEHYFPEDKPAFDQIKLCLEQMRYLRPALVQTAEQLRMAVILAQQLHLAASHQLTNQASLQIEQATDRMIFHYHVQCDERNQMLRSSGSDRFRFYASSSDLGTPSFSSDESFFTPESSSEEDDNAVCQNIRP